MCGETEGPMHIDHVIPKRLNGSDELWNLRQLCQKCNLVKGGRFFETDKTLAAWMCNKLNAVRTNDRRESRELPRRRW